MKIVYAVTSGGRDLFSVMTRLSAASVRLTHPGASIVIVCDAASDAAVWAWVLRSGDFAAHFRNWDLDGAYRYYRVLVYVSTLVPASA